LVSYRHLSGLLAHYGEEPIIYYVGPLAVDGLMVMATGALLATKRQHHPAPALPVPPVSAPAATPAPTGSVAAPSIPSPPSVAAAKPTPPTPSTPAVTPAVVAQRISPQPRPGR